jgi:hypothetical protein
LARSGVDPLTAAQMQAEVLTAAGRLLVVGPERDALRMTGELNELLARAMGAAGAIDAAVQKAAQAREADASTALARLRAAQPPAAAGAAETASTAPANAAEARTRLIAALLHVFTNGVADDRIERAATVLSDAQFTANEKLTKIDALMPFPATASAQQLGDLLAVKKQAVLKTDWWIQNRKGKKEEAIGRRREVHRQRAKRVEPPGQADDGE